MHATLQAWTVLVALTGPLDAGAAPAEVPAEARIGHCLISLIDDVEVPAQEPGVLLTLEAREGMQVEAGAVLGQIDDSKAEMAKRVAVAEMEVAKKQAENDINVQYSVAQRDVAVADYMMNKEANDRVQGAKPRSVLQQLALVARRSELAIEQAQLEQDVAMLTADARHAQVDAADEDIRRRQIVAPIGGVVQEVKPHAGEWLNPGDMVVRIVRLDRLRVEGFLNAHDFSVDEVFARPVEVYVQLERGRIEAFRGKVVFVDPVVGPGGEYRIFAEVDNRERNGQWLLRPGLPAEMTIHTGALMTSEVSAR